MSFERRLLEQSPNSWHQPHVAVGETVATSPTASVVWSKGETRPSMGWLDWWHWCELTLGHVQSCTVVTGMPVEVHLRATSGADEDQLIKVLEKKLPSVPKIKAAFLDKLSPEGGWTLILIASYKRSSKLVYDRLAERVLETRRQLGIVDLDFLVYSVGEADWPKSRDELCQYYRRIL